MTNQSDGQIADPARRELAKLTQHLPQTITTNETAPSTIVPKATKAALKTVLHLAQPQQSANPEENSLLRQAARAAAGTAHQAADHSLRSAFSTLTDLQAPITPRTCASIIESAGKATAQAHNAVLHNSFPTLPNHQAAALKLAASQHANRIATLIALATNADSVLERIPTAHTDNGPTGT